jgi:hypothetical protein
VASVVSATERNVPAKSGVAATPAGSQAEANAHAEPQLTQRSVATADYAELQANIADVVARLDPPRPNGAQLADQADQALMALMPQPVIVLPMPPTDQDMIQFVAQVAQSVASQAAMARAAQARVSPALADAAVH